MWARLREGKFMRIQGADIHTPKDESYGKCQQVLAKAGNTGKLDTLQIVVYDSRLTVAGSVWEPYIYHHARTPTEARDTWLERFAPRCRVPVDPSWSTPLWLRGIEAGAIVGLDGFGPPVFKINRETETWLPLVQGMLGFTPPVVEAIAA